MPTVGPKHLVAIRFGINFHRTCCIIPSLYPTVSTAPARLPNLAVRKLNVQSRPSWDAVGQAPAIVLPFGDGVGTAVLASRAAAC